MSRLRSAHPLFITLLLCACSPDPQALDPGAAQVPETAPVADASATAAFNTSNTVKDVMTTLIDANARQLWSAVSYVVTEAGVEETLPQTEADWQGLRANAVALIEGGNALLITGRLVDLPVNAAEYPDFQFTPDEIAQLISADPDSWAFNLQDMQAAALDTLAAIDDRDLLAFTERAALINQACEACHAQYWYRPLPMRGNEGLR